MDRDDDHPVYHDDVIVADEVFTTNIDDLVCVDNTWNTLSVGGAGSVLVSNGTGEFTWSSIDVNETKIKEMLKEQRVRGNIKNGKHTPKRCYE